MGSSLTPGFNYVRLGEHILTAEGTILDVSNIPSGYRFLVCYLSYEPKANLGTFRLRFNNDSTANAYYTQMIISSGGVLAGSATTADYAEIANGATQDRQASYLITINQDAVTTYKGFHSEGGSGIITHHTTNTWNNATEINRITAYSVGANIKAGSSLIIYGVR